MKRIFKYIACLALSGIVACQPETDPVFIDAAIHFSSGGVSTKDYLDSDDLLVNGTQVKVYDVLTGFDGDINGTSHSSSDTFVYLEDVVQYSSGTAYWPYASGSEYLWTREGVHRFFGWLELDKSYNTSPYTQGLRTNTFFGEDPELDTNPNSDTFLTMTTPEYSWTPESPQYDFLYSARATVRDSHDSRYSAHETIAMQMKHMFTAVALCFKNSSELSDVEITGLGSMYGEEDLFLHKGHATVDYSSSDNPIQPTYDLTGDPEHLFFSGAAMSGITIHPDEIYDIFTGTLISTDKGATYTSDPQFYMTWPLTADQSWPQLTTGEYDVYGNPIYDPRNKILALSYIANGQIEESTRVHFPYTAWVAGKRMLFTIDFTDKSIQIESQVLPWDLNVHNMNFDQDGVSSDGLSRLSIDGMDTLSDDATVYITPETPEYTCHVEIHSCAGATLIISKVGPDPSYFEVYPSAITLTNSPVTFVVRASDLHTGGVERKMNLSMTVELPNGREVDVNTELLSGGNNYTFSRR